MGDFFTKKYGTYHSICYTIVTISEDFSINHLDYLREFLDQEKKIEGLNLLLDMEDVKMLYSQQIGVLFSASKSIRRNGGNIGFVNCTELLVRNFNAIGMKSVAPVYSSKEEAFEDWLSSEKV